MSIAFIIMHYAYVVFSVLWHSFTVVCREHQRQSRAHSLLCYKLLPILKADQCSGSYHQLTMDRYYRASQSHRRRLLLRIQCTSCLISKWTAVSPGRGRCHIDGCSVSVPITSTASRTSWNDMSSGSSCYTLCHETRPTLATVPCAVHWRGDVSGSRLTTAVAAPAAIRRKDLDAVVAINRCRRYRRKSCCSLDAFHLLSTGPSALWRCWLSGRKGIWPVKTEWCGAGMVICLERGADLHLPLTVSCFSKIQICFTFLVPAHPGSPEKGPLKVCVCVSTGKRAVLRCHRLFRQCVLTSFMPRSILEMWLEALFLGSLSICACVGGVIL